MFKRYKARFFDKKGEYIGSTGFNKNKDTFRYKNKSFVYDSTNLSYYERTPLWSLGLLTIRTYFYNLDNVYPIELSKKTSIKQISPEQLDIILESDALKKLNESYKKSFLENLNFKTLAIIAIIAIIGYYVFIQKGKLW